MINHFFGPSSKVSTGSWGSETLSWVGRALEGGRAFFGLKNWPWLAARPGSVPGQISNAYTAASESVNAAAAWLQASTYLGYLARVPAKTHINWTICWTSEHPASWGIKWPWCHGNGGQCEECSRHCSNQSSRDGAMSALLSKTTSLAPRSFQWVFLQLGRLWKALLSCKSQQNLEGAQNESQALPFFRSVPAPLCCFGVVQSLVFWTPCAFVLHEVLFGHSLPHWVHMHCLLGFNIRYAVKCVQRVAC